MAEPRPRTYYTTMLKERHRAERAEEHAAAFKRRWADERARAEAAEAEARALRDVVRRYHEGWMPDAEPVGDETFNRWYLESGMDDTDIGGTEPMTDAEAEAIRAATADPTPQTDTDDASDPETP